MLSVSLLSLRTLLLMSVFISLNSAHEGPPDKLHYYCSGKSVGNYVDAEKPCSSLYYSCIDDGYPARGIARTCPTNLFFSEQHNRCLEEKFVEACQAPASAETQFEKFLRVHSFVVPSCADGKYEHPDEACSARYVLCKGTHVDIRLCPFPSFLRFDAVSGRCLQQNHVRSCNAHTQSTHYTINAKALQCTHDGTYFVQNPVEPCSRHYFTCVNGQSYRLSCPENLYFDRVSGNCVNARSCPSCAGTVHVQGFDAHVHTALTAHTAPHTPAHAHAVPVQSVSVSHSHVTSAPSISTQHCTNRPDGTYFIDCSSFVQCRDRVSLITHCAQNQVCDVRLMRCVARELCPAPCGTLNRNLLSVLAQTHNVYAHVPPAATPKVQVAVPQSLSLYPSASAVAAVQDVFSCAHRLDGNYAEGDCSNTYYTCAHGTPTQRHCPHNLVYSSLHDSCESEQSLKVCGATDAGTIMCAQHAYGTYALDCYSYVVCNAHVAVVESCLPSQVYFAQQQRCVDTALCPAPCGTLVHVATADHNTGKHVPTVYTHPVPAVVRSHPVPAVVHSHPVPAVVRSHPVPAEVHSHVVPAEVHSHPVPAVVRSHPVPAVVHSHVVPAEVHSHPAPSVVHSHHPVLLQHNSVQYPSPRPAVHSHTSVQSPIVHLPAPAHYQAEAPVAVNHVSLSLQGVLQERNVPGHSPSTSNLPTHAPVFECWSKPDGQYAVGSCNNTFYLCTDSYRLLKHCPLNQYFDAMQSECVPTEQLPECPQPPAPDADLCTDKEDGIYPIDCVSYVFCREQQGVVSRCAEGLGFHSVLFQCQPLNECPAPCGSAPANTTHD